MSHSKRAAHRRSRLPVGYLIGVAALAGAAASIYVLATNVLASDPDPGRGIGLSMIPPPPSLDQTGPGGADRQLLDRCLEELAAGDELIAVAQTGVDHWAAHIQARSDGLSGEITNEEMRAIWKETRLAGPDDIAAYTAAADRYAAVAGPCEEEPTAGADAVSPACTSRAGLLAAAAETARVVIGAWDGHLANMRKFADGGMTAHEAQHEWEQAWARAPGELEAHAAAVQAVRDTPACEPVETT
jgi:hypothetical protein